MDDDEFYIDDDTLDCGCCACCGCYCDMPYDRFGYPNEDYVGEEED